MAVIAEVCVCACARGNRSQQGRSALVFPFFSCSTSHITLRKGCNGASRPGGARWNYSASAIDQMHANASSHLLLFLFLLPLLLLFILFFLLFFLGPFLFLFFLFLLLTPATPAIKIKRPRAEQSKQYSLLSMTSTSAAPTLGVWWTSWS